MRHLSYLRSVLLTSLQLKPEGDCIFRVCQFVQLFVRVHLWKLHVIVCVFTVPLELTIRHISYAPEVPHGHEKGVMVFFRNMADKFLLHFPDPLLAAKSLSGNAIDFVTLGPKLGSKLGPILGSKLGPIVY